MAKAIAPKEIPALPKGAMGWARSTKRAGGMYHAHALGFPVCRSGIVIDRHASVELTSVAAAQHWGVCPKCYRLSLDASESA